MGFNSLAYLLQSMLVNKCDIPDDFLNHIEKMITLDIPPQTLSSLYNLITAYLYSL